METDQIRYRASEISKMLRMNIDIVAYRIKELGLVPTDQYWYDEYQIELIREFETSPKVQYIIRGSKMNQQSKFYETVYTSESDEII